jgi:diamine N-acetyltransferase
MFKSDKIYLRVVEKEDATRLLVWENNPNHWRVTDTEVPFSLQAIYGLIEQQQQIRATGQLRMMICLNTDNQSVGAIDLYDVDFKNGNAGVGILIGEEANRNKGYAKEALILLIEYAKNILALHNLVASIQSDNDPSIALFESVGFKKIGIKKEWFFFKGKRIDEISYQLCLKS